IDLQRDALAIWRKPNVEPVCECGSERRRVSVAIHPLNRSTTHGTLTGQIRQRTAPRHRKLSPTRCSTRDYTFDDWRRRACYSEPLDVERHRKQCSVVEIDDMAAGYIAAVIAAALNDGARACGYRLNDQV